MNGIRNILEDRIADAMRKVTGTLDCRAFVTPCTEAAFGDYQANGVMQLAGRLGTNPRSLAEKILSCAVLDDICQSAEIAGPGFINMRLSGRFIGSCLMAIAADPGRLSIAHVEQPQTVVVDFSGPNVAKQMHVGHLRSTILGDFICRLLEFRGHKVVRQNHIGDWGTQFGMLLAYMQEQSAGSAHRWKGSPGDTERCDRFHIADLEQFYRAAKLRFDTDPAFAETAHRQVVSLHNRHPAAMLLWKRIVDESRRHYQPLYGVLNVKLSVEQERGESFYADRLDGIVCQLLDSGIARMSEGAVCVFPPGFKNKSGKPMGFVIKKSDGAYLYATTDLAAVRYRIEELGADRIIYVTDARQQLHFQMLFATVQMAGWATNTALVHVTFGSVLGEDGSPLKTRSGENVKLRDLLDEAVRRARDIIEQKNTDLAAEDAGRIATAVGIGAIKYADFNNNRLSDYVFSFDKMLAMDGNTAPYMQYAYARIRSIERKARERNIAVQAECDGVRSPRLDQSAELELAKCLCRYGDVLESAETDYRPNCLTGYLFELAQKFSGFYTNCPVLDAGPDQRPSRLLLCDLTARTISHGLGELLGIEMPEKM